MPKLDKNNVIEFQFRILPVPQIILGQKVALLLRKCALAHLLLHNLLNKIHVFICNTDILLNSFVE